MRWYIYGEVFFTTTQRRNNAGRRLDNFVAQLGFIAGLWDLLLQVNPAWPAGRADITGVADNGSTVPGIRFCYYTTDDTAARSAMDDIVQNWARFEDTNSFWAYTAVPDGARLGK